MKFKPGDKVRFLNAKGGGIVMKEINAFMVSVAIEDGFEVPTLISELVAIEPAGPSGDLFRDKTAITDENIMPQTEPEKLDRSLSEIVIRGNNNAYPQGVYLAWAPQNQKSLLSGMIDIYLINNTENEILYTFFIKNNEGTFSGIDYSSVPPFSKKIFESIIREDIAIWSHGVVQILFFRDETDKILVPTSVSFRVKGSHFYQEGSYHETPMLTGQKAIVYTVCELNRVPDIIEQALNEKEGYEPLPEKAEKFRPETLIERYRIAPGEAEVDLHISALREKYDNLSPHEILSIQMGHFERTLSSAIAFRFHKVIYIHGIGNGTLKQLLINLLNEYENIEFRNASYARYGNGAIELILHNNQ